MGLGRQLPDKQECGSELLVLMRSSLYIAGCAASSIRLTPAPPIHQSVQHNPLYMQLSRRTAWKWLQFSGLIAFLRTRTQCLYIQTGPPGLLHSYLDMNR